MLSLCKDGLRHDFRSKKREIEDSIRLAFDKYFYQHYQDVFSKLNFHQDVNVNRIDKEDRFFQKRELDINSYIYMLRKRFQEQDYP